ncbi:hypothetical protein Tco_1018572 [Tanacetum coccineum]|uniref:Uncharacterized protein n=1 Tax=Tanacetum coccineum TaxID=301880 RepID=A0ABQ5FWP7_9ASTR
MTMDQLRSTKQKANEIFLLGRSIPRNGDPFCRSIPLWLALSISFSHQEYPRVSNPPLSQQPHDEQDEPDEGKWTNFRLWAVTTSNPIIFPAGRLELNVQSASAGIEPTICRWSFNHSAMDGKETQRVTARWHNKDEVTNYSYGPFFQIERHQNPNVLAALLGKKSYLVRITKLALSFALRRHCDAIGLRNCCDISAEIAGFLPSRVLIATERNGFRKDLRIDCARHEKCPDPANQVIIKKRKEENEKGDLRIWSGDDLRENRFLTGRKREPPVPGNEVRFGKREAASLEVEREGNRKGSPSLCILLAAFLVHPASRITDSFAVIEGIHKLRGLWRESQTALRSPDESMELSRFLLGLMSGCVWRYTKSTFQGRRKKEKKKGFRRLPPFSFVFAKGFFAVFIFLSARFNFRVVGNSSRFAFFPSIKEVSGDDSELEDAAEPRD